MHQVVDRISENRNKVFFGAWVLLVDDHDIENIYRIVAPDKLEPQLSYISMDSPMDKILPGTLLDDEFSLQLPERKATDTILEVSYSHTER